MNRKNPHLVLVKPEESENFYVIWHTFFKQPWMWGPKEFLANTFDGFSKNGSGHFSRETFQEMVVEARETSYSEPELGASWDTDIAFPFISGYVLRSTMRDLLHIYDTIPRGYTEKTLLEACDDVLQKSYTGEEYDGVCLVNA